MQTLPESRVSTTGRIITERDLRQGIAYSNTAIVLAMIFVTAGGMPLAMLMERLNASGKLVGLLSTVSLSAGMFQIISSLLTERLPARKPMWFWNCLIHRALWLVLPLLLVLAATGFPGLRHRLPVLVIVTLGVSSFFASMGSAPWLSWMSDFLPDHVRARFWAFRNAFIYGAMLVTVFVFGWILDQFPMGDATLRDFTGFIIVFAIASLSGVADVFVHNRVLEPAPRRELKPAPVWEMLKAPFRSEEYRRVMRAVGLWHFAIFLAAPFSAIFLKETFSVTYTHLSYTTAAAGVGGILGAFIARLIVDRVGARTLSAVCLLIHGLCVLVWFFMRPGDITFRLPFVGLTTLPQPIVLLILANIPAGLCSAVLASCQTTLITAKVPALHRTPALAIYQGGLSLMGGAGSFLGGYLVDAYRDVLPAGGLLPTVPWLGAFTYFHVLIAMQLALKWMVLVPLHLRIKELGEGVSFRHAVIGLVTGNPMRMVSNMFNLHVLQSSPEAHRRARAIRELGDSRNSLAVTDLAALLDDSDADVREEAALALGRIGSQAAVDALLEKLEDPNIDIGPEIVKGLRRARDPRAVPALIRQLGAGPPEVQVETARTLGVLGDRRAVQPLLDALYAGGEERINSAASEALARLGEMDAIFRIIPRMRETRNRVVKRSMACAVGDLLGEPGEFYRVLNGELQSHGLALGRLLGRLRHEIRSLPDAATRRDSPDLPARIEQVESAYLLRDYAACVREALDLAARLASLKHGIRFTGDMEVFAEVLIWTERRFGVGLWFLDLLRQGGDPDPIEAMLAVYFLSKWTAAGSAGRPDSPPAS